MKRWTAVFLAGIMALDVLSPSVVRADAEDILFMDIPIVTIATKDAEKVADVPATVYVINRQDMDHYGMRDLKDALWMFPGMELSYQGNWMIGGHRGFTGNFSGSSLRINGREYTNMIAGETFISQQYGLHDTSRVELLQGPASVLYGTQAMEGVINVVTRIHGDERNDFTEASVTGGSFNTQEINGSFGKTFAGEDGWLGVSARNYESTGDKLADWLASIDFSRDTTFQVNRFDPRDPRYAPNQKREGSNMDFYAAYKGYYVGGGFFRNYVRVHQEYPDTLPGNRTDLRENRLVYSGYKYDIGDKWDIGLDVEYRNEDNITQGPGPFPASGNIADQDMGNWQMPNNQKRKVNLETSGGVYAHTLTVGVEYMETLSGDSISTTFYYLMPSKQSDYATFSRSGQSDILKNTFKAVYANDKWDVLGNRRLLFHAGVRYDKPKFAKEQTSPRLSAIWHPDEQSTVKVNYGKGFRVANIWEIQQNTAVGLSPRLPNREMETVELDLERIFANRWTSGLNFYKNNAKIYQQRWIPGATAGSGGFAQWPSGRHTRGFEWVNRVRLRRGVGGFLNYSYVDPDNQQIDGVDVDAPSVAKNKVQTGAFYDFLNHYGVALSARWVDKIQAEMLQTDGTTRPEWLKAYAQVDFTFNIRDVDLDGMRAGFRLGVKNLFDKGIFVNNPRGTQPAKFKLDGRDIFAMATVAF